MRRIAFAAAAVIPRSHARRPGRVAGVIARTHGIALAALLGAASVAGAYSTITTAQARRLGDEARGRRVGRDSEAPCPPGRVGGVVAQGPRDEAAGAARDPALRPCRPREHPVVRRTAGTLAHTHDDCDDHDDGRGGHPGLPAGDTDDTRLAFAGPHPARRYGTPPDRPRDDQGRGGDTRARRAGSDDDAGGGRGGRPAATAAAPAPAPAPPTTTAPTPQPAPTTLSKSDAEKQCEALKRAAEGQGEAAKKDAERRCEELKKAAEGDD